MLRFSLVGEPMRVGGEKRERSTRVTLVFSQMKGHPPDCVPERILRFQPSRQAGRGAFAGYQRTELLPESGQQIEGEKLAAAHGRRFLDEFRKPFALGRQHRYRPAIDSSGLTKPLQ